MRALRAARAVGVALTMASLFVVLPSYARSESFANFSSTAGLTLSGTAVTAMTVDGTVLRLTPPTTNVSGSAFGTIPINAADFSTFFRFRMTNPGGAADENGHIGGDGFTFAIQSVSASLGGSAQGLGIGGVMPSVAVEFDTWFDSPNLYPQVSDPNSNHLGIDINGDVHSRVTMAVDPAMDDGNIWYAWINYDGRTLRISANETGVLPPTPQMSYVVDIPAILGVSDAFVGFTASTGGSFQNHDILSWTYFDHYDGGLLDDGATLDDGAAPDDGSANSSDEDASNQLGGDATVEGDGGGVNDDGGVAVDGSVDGSGGGGPDASGRGSKSGGCGCVVGEGSRASGGALLAGSFYGVFFVRRRRRRAQSLRARASALSGSSLSA